LARYAWGNDYHDAMKTRLRQLGAWLSERLGRQVKSRIFVDDGPLVERDAALRAGLGFRGKTRTCSRRLARTCSSVPS
jgi:epoxyqueuosine reductase